MIIRFPEEGSIPESYQMKVLVWLLMISIADWDPDNRDENVPYYVEKLRGTFEKYKGFLGAGLRPVGSAEARDSALLVEADSDLGHGPELGYSVCFDGLHSFFGGSAFGGGFPPSPRSLS